jgi:hypothetical protein
MTRARERDRESAPLSRATNRHAERAGHRYLQLVRSSSHADHAAVTSLEGVACSACATAALFEREAAAVRDWKEALLAAEKERKAKSEVLRAPVSSL